MKKALVCGLYFLVSNCLAADLLDIFYLSLENDPTYKQALSTFLATSESVPEARAALLPQISFNSQVSRSYQNARAGIFSTEQTYYSDQWGLNASQAVFNYQAWSKLQQAKANVKSALATYNDASQELMLRAATAYFSVLLSKDTLTFAEAKLRANKRQLEQAQQRFNVGLDAITSVYEAQAAYDQSIAEVIGAKNTQTNRNEDIRKLTNHVFADLAPLRDSRIPLITPEPNNVDEWISAGLKQNYKLFSAKYSLQAARENIRVQNAGNWPTFTIQAYNNVTHNSSPQSVFVPAAQKSASLALALNFPAVQGGLIEAQTRQAQYEFQTSSEQLESIFRDIEVNTVLAYNNIISGISKIKADRVTVQSQQNSLNSVDAQFQAGTRTMTDVVIAQERLFEAQEQLASDQYRLINSILQLKYLAGTLNVSDLEEINAWLKTTRIASLNPKSKPCLIAKK